MNKHVNLDYNFTGLSGPFAAYGSFGWIDGDKANMPKLTETDNAFKFNGDGFTIDCVYTEYEDGVVSRKDSFTNTSNKPITLNKYLSRFFFPFFETDVYTQHNAWSHESTGGWQPLVTGVTCQNAGIRTGDGATPMTAIYNRQSKKTTVFHLIPEGAWKITVMKKAYYGKNDNTVVEFSLGNDNPIAITIAPGETFEMPEIIYFNAENKTDLDAYKLHNYYNAKYPRRFPLPILFSTWLYRFNELDINKIFKQIETAAYLGIEYFNVDCGWFGEDIMFFENVGRWYESSVMGFKGKLKEVADKIHSEGMKFGLWFETERAWEKVECVKEHPEYYITSGDGDYFLDYSKEEAQDYTLEVLSKNIDAYGIDFIKFDFNRTMSFDPSWNGFHRYIRGYRKFIEKLKAKYPNLYICNCAGGGSRLDLNYHRYMDSTWPTDNQGQFEGLDIFKNTMLRMPSCLLERWGVWTYSNPIPNVHEEGFVDQVLPLICNNATWENIAAVSEDYIHGFLQGGPMGISCDIASFPQENKDKLKALISEYKVTREFYKAACTHILLDDKNMVALQYNDKDETEVVIRLFAKNKYQPHITLYPALKSGKYEYEGKVYTVEELKANGITFKDTVDFNCYTAKLKKVK